jgi:hypothetical protein
LFKDTLKITQEALCAKNDLLLVKIFFENIFINFINYFSGGINEN